MGTASITIEKARRDLHPLIKDFLVESESIYPGIDRWWQRRVVPGIASGERLCRVALAGEAVVALAIGKHSHGSAKFCTLRVAEGYQGRGIGQSLLRATLMDMLDAGCQRVHYTISEQIAERWGNFFQPYEFQLKRWHRNRYVRGVDELAFEATAAVLKRALTDMPVEESAGGMIVLSIRPEYASMIEHGRKLVEFRRRFSTRHQSACALLYVTSPVQQIRSCCRLMQVIRATPQALWKRFGHLSGVTRALFNRYFHGVAEGSALCLSEVRRLPRPLSLEGPELRRAGFHPPQSYSWIASNSPLARLIHS